MEPQQNGHHSFAAFVRENHTYMQNNKARIAAANVATLRQVTFVYMLGLCMYLIIGLFMLPERNLQYYYVPVILVQLTVSLFINARYRVPRAWEEVNLLCVAFCVWVMAFIIFISSFDKPAIYYVPLIIAMAVLFIFPLWQTTLLCLCSSCAMLVVSFCRKSPEAFMYDVQSVAIGFLVALICTIFTARIRMSDSASRAQLERLSVTDKLTGLSNKASMEFLCRNEISRFSQYTCAMLLLDLDNFKQINDSLGHAQGDEVLRRFADICRTSVRDSDIVGRFGGDEFLILMRNTADETIVRRKAQEILRRTRSLLGEETTIAFSCSIGIALCNNAVATYESLLFRADRALYTAKAAGKGQCCVYSIETPAAEKEKPLLLVADDQEVSRAILRSCLSEKYAVLEAENGQDAVALLQENCTKVRAVLLDLMMPIMDGYGVLDAMHKDARLAKIPVLIISAQKADREQLQTLGAVDLVAKPFDPAQVKETVNKVLAPAAEEVSALVRK